MSDLIHIAMGFPTVVLTGLVALSLVYWLFVILGAIDVDIIGDVDLDAGADIGIDAGGDVDAGGELEGGGGAFLSALGINKVPLTISLSVWWILSWMLTLVGVGLLDSALGGLPAWALATIVLLAALIVALPLTGIAVKPIAPLFHIHEAKAKSDYVGSVCTVTTGRVDHGFGQAELIEGGDHLRIKVRCDDAETVFERGDRALIIDFDKGRDAYVIEPMTELMGERKDD